MSHLLLAWVPTLYRAVRRAVPPWSPRVPRTFHLFFIYSLARLNGIPFASGCDEAYITLSVALRRRPLPLNGRRRPRVTPTVTPPRDRSVGACALQQRAGKRPPPSACSPPRKRQRPREMGSPVREESPTARSDVHRPGRGLWSGWSRALWPAICAALRPAGSGSPRGALCLAVSSSPPGAPPALHARGKLLVVNAAVRVVALRVRPRAAASALKHPAGRCGAARRHRRVRRAL